MLTVSPARQPFSTSDGKLLIRTLDVHNQPGCRPLYAYALTNWLAERGQTDPTAQPVLGATWEDLDPVEFARLCRLVAEPPGDAALLGLSDPEIARALGLVRPQGDRLTPSLAGLLLLGKEPALREHVPTHEVAFQVLHGTDVAVNEFRRWPLLRVHEWLTEAVGVRNKERELMIGGVRVGVPRYDRAGVQEAINNALIRRDYGRLGAIHAQLHDDHVRLSNPGGFVKGVYPGNLLVVEPRPPFSTAEAILAYVQAHGRITRREAVAVSGLTEEQAHYRLHKLVERSALRLVGSGRSAHDVAAQREENGE